MILSFFTIIVISMHNKWEIQCNENKCYDKKELSFGCNH